MKGISFAVITKIPVYDGTYKTDGNLSTGMALMRKYAHTKGKRSHQIGSNGFSADVEITAELEELSLTDKYTMVNFLEQVFDLGEILILNSDTGREIAGKGRKPDKWMVEYIEYKTVEPAIRCALEIKKRIALNNHEIPEDLIYTTED